MKISQTYLLILLAVLSTIAPMSIATYLPSMPTMAKHFLTNISNIELSLSIFMFGFSLGQLCGGPLSDRKGRKTSSLIGLFGFSFFSILIIFSSSIYELWIYRFLEAFFGGLIVINSTAIVRDLYSGQDAARFFSLLGSLRSIIPMIAPAIGSFILIFFSWEAIFVFLSLYSLLLAILIIKDLEETFTYKKINVFKSYLSVLTHKKAMISMSVIALSFSGLFSIVTKTAFIYLEYFKVGVELFPFFYGFNFLLVLIFTSLNVKLIKVFKQLNIVKAAILLQIIFTLLLVIFYDLVNIYTASILLGLYLAMNGLIFGNATALTMEHFPHNSGVASALIGVVQFGLASTISFVIASFVQVTLLPLALTLFIISIISIFIIRKY